MLASRTSARGLSVCKQLYRKMDRSCAQCSKLKPGVLETAVSWTGPTPPDTCMLLCLPASVPFEVRLACYIDALSGLLDPC